MPVHPVSQKLILCIDDDPAVLSYEKALLLPRDSLPKTEAGRVSAIAVPDKMTNPVTDLETCTAEQLESALARVLAYASGEVLNEAEVRIRRRSPVVTAA